MSTVLASALTAVGAAILGALLNYYIVRGKPDSNKKKTIIARSKSGKFEVFTVPADTSDRGISDYVITNIALEREISEQIKNLQRTIRNFHVHHGKVVDLIAAHEGSKVAIEVKSSLDNVDLRSIQRYMSEEAGISKLLIVSSQTAPNSLLDATRELIESGRVSILKVDPSSASDEELLSSAVQDALRVPQV